MVLLKNWDKTEIPHQLAGGLKARQMARELPEFPRPLKNWGAPWLVREILAARDQRLGDALEIRR